MIRGTAAAAVAAAAAATDGGDRGCRRLRRRRRWHGKEEEILPKVSDSIVQLPPLLFGSWWFGREILPLNGLGVNSLKQWFRVEQGSSVSYLY